MKKYKANMIVLINIDVNNARTICANMEAEFVDDYRKHPDLKDLEEGEDYHVHTLTSFMEAANDGDIYLENYFVAFFNNI